MASSRAVRLQSSCERHNAREPCPASPLFPGPDSHSRTVPAEWLGHRYKFPSLENPSDPKYAAFLVDSPAALHVEPSPATNNKTLLPLPFAVGPKPSDHVVDHVTAQSGGRRGYGG
jgi:hypothetical protein